MPLSPAEIRHYLESRVPKLKKVGRELRAPCPIHHGRRDSFSVNVETGDWFCHSECGRGGDVFALEMALNGFEFKRAHEEVFRLVGRSSSSNGNGASRRIVNVYDYPDESGTVLFRVVRTAPKGFFQQRPDGHGGWINNMAGVRRVLFNLPSVIAAKIVFVVEGEKDARAMRELGVVATCNPGGAGKWRDEYSKFLRGKEDVFVIPDNDEKGRAHADAVMQSLGRIGVKAKLIELPGAKDVSEWIDRGGTLEKLVKLAEQAHADRQQDSDDADAVKKFCTQLRLAGGFTDERLRAAAHAFNVHCPSPLDAAQVDAIVNWVLTNIRSGAGGGQTTASAATDWTDPIPLRDRSVPALRADRIPGALGDQVAAVAEATETPVEMAALIGTAAVSSCIAKKAIVQVEPGYFEPVNVYAAPAMESGNRKTAVLNHMTAPLMEWERVEARRLEPEIKRAASKRKTFEARIEILRKIAAKSPLDATAVDDLAEMEASLPDIPPAPRLWMQDMTAEILAVEMQQHGERMAVFSDEGGLFDILAGRYTGSPNFDLINQAHSGSPVRVNRISRPPVFLGRPVLTIGISPQPDVLARLSATPQFRGRGLLARFLYAVPASPLGTRSLACKACPDDISEAYGELIKRLLKLSPQERNGLWQPWTLNLSSGAYERWKAFQRSTEGLMKEGGRLQYLRDWASKLPGATARIAGIFHCVTADPVAMPVISRETMDQAIDLATPLIDHALAAFELMGRDPTIEDAQRILAWIQRERYREFVLRDCFRAHQSRFRRVGQISPALHLLVEHGYLRLAPQTKVAYRPSERYLVNPQVLEEVTR
jgi:5S rRNA maturation endonuclease (ribonuclease M5)